MSYHSKREARRNTEYEEDEDDLYGSANRKSPQHETSEDALSQAGGSPKDKPPMEQDKRLRREIANSNERRRMQSINSGFESLKTLIPHTDGEKLSKAAILHHTSDYITALESEKTRLLTHNAKLKQELLELGHGESDLSSGQGSPPPKRKKRDTESSDEGIGLSSGDFDEPTLEELKREMIYLRSQLDRERRLRIMLEEQTRSLESQLYPERLRQIANQVQAQMRYQEEKQKYLEAQRRIQEEQEEALAVRNAPVTAASPNSSASAPTSAPTPAPTPAAISTPTPTPAVTIPATIPAPNAASSPTTTAPMSSPRPSTAAPPVVPKRQPVPAAAPIATNSMSRRNLETIVEAIRHLEGDNILFDGVSQNGATHMDDRSTTSSTAMMEGDSVYAGSHFASSSGEEDDDDFRHCAGSGRNSPMSSSSKMADATSLLALRACDAAAVTTASRRAEVCHHQQQHHKPYSPHQHPHSSSPHTSLMLNSGHRFSIASQLMQGPEQQQHPHGMGFVQQRPAVIVKHLS